MFEGAHTETVTAEPGSVLGATWPVRPILAGVNGRPVVAVTLHGVAHDDDLAVQAFARHLETMTAGRAVVAGMRAFLEDKPSLAPPPPWSSASAPPATGYRAVELLAAAAGCAPAQIAAARLASRHDLAGTAWILDPADGLDELLILLAGRADLVLAADPDDPATGPVLDALELADRFPAVAPAGLAAALAGRRALLIDTGWLPDLAAAHAAGHATALVDRFGCRDGTPLLRALDLAGLLPGVADWLDRQPPGEGEP